MQDCLVPNCPDPAKVRGLCERCYANANRMVRAGQTTWEELTELGLAMSSRRTIDENLTFRRALQDARAKKAFGDLPGIGKIHPGALGEQS